MSNDILRLISIDPAYVASPEAQQQAKKLLRSLLPNADAINIRQTETVECIDQGSNFDRILCPYCGVELPLDWWHKKMANAHRMEFSGWGVTLPCCGSSSSLNDLHYDMPAGFARMVLEARNSTDHLIQQHTRSLEACLGFALTVLCGGGGHNT